MAKYAGALLALLLLLVPVAFAQEDNMPERMEESMGKVAGIVNVLLGLVYDITAGILGFDDQEAAKLAGTLHLPRVLVTDGDKYAVVSKITTGYSEVEKCIKEENGEYSWDNNNCENNICATTSSSSTEPITTGEPVEINGRQYYALKEVHVGNCNNEYSITSSEMNFELINYPWPSATSKAELLLYMYIIPLAIVFALLYNFFHSTGLFSWKWSAVITAAITIMLTRLGIYNSLIDFLGSLFGDFFLSLLFLYLVLAIIFWFYGGIRASKAVAEKRKRVADAIVEAYATDLKKGLLIESAAEGMTKK